MFKLEQVVIGSFVPGHHQQEKKPKKQKYGHSITFGPVSPEERYEAGYTGGSNLNVHGDTLGFENPAHHSKTAPHENNVQFGGEDSGEPSHEITC